jgi:hypothetical protein
MLRRDGKKTREPSPCSQENRPRVQQNGVTPNRPRVHAFMYSEKNHGKSQCFLLFCFM